MRHFLHRSVFGKEQAAVKLSRLAMTTATTAQKVGRGVAFSVSQRLHRRPRKRRRSIRDYIIPRRAGVITGAADNDPSGVITFTQAGATTGLSLLWLVPLAWPMMVVVEEMSARVGIVVKKGLNRVIADRFGRRTAVITALIVASCNIITIGADLAFMSQIAAILTPIPITLWVLSFGGLLLLLLLKKGYAVVSRFLILITPVFLAYIVATFLVPDIPWAQVLSRTFVPIFEADFNKALIALGIFGTLISPYLIFWQTTEEIEEGKRVNDIDEESAGVVSGMLLSQLIVYFIMLLAALVLFGQVEVVETAEQAASALAPLAGRWSFLLFSVGILGSGILAIPVLAASTAYVVADTFDWQEGLDKNQSEAQGFYAVILLSMAAGIGIALSGFSPVIMLVYSQVLNGILVPVLLIYLIRLANDRRLMGKHINSWLANVIAWLTVTIMAVLTGLLLYSFL